MSAELFKQVFQAPDGTMFDSKAEVLDYLRKPKVMAELNKITKDPELSNFLYEKQEYLEEVFESGTIRRVKKTEYNALKKALEAIKVSDNKAYQFVIDNADAIQESFRWPSVKRMDPEEKAKLIQTSLMGLTENNQELVNWIVASKDKIFEAYEAGKIKREVSDKATNALAEYRAQKAQEKLEADTAAAEAEGITLEEYRAKNAKKK